MHIEVLASGSKANSYLIKGNNDSLLLEAGLPIKELKRLLNYNIPANCLITHSHKDHSKCAKELQRLGTNIKCSEGTAYEIEIGLFTSFTMRRKDGSYYFSEVGDFVVQPFGIEHDCPEPDPLGYLIHCKENKKNILFVTDTAYIRQRINDVNIAMIECNYAIDILDANNINPTLRDRIVQSHFELERVKDFFMANDLSKLEQVVLIHLSDNNSDAERFQKEIQEVVKVPVHIAEPGLKIQI